MGFIFILGIIGFLIYSRGFRHFAALAVVGCLVIVFMASMAQSSREQEAETAKLEAAKIEAQHIANKDCGYHSGRFDLGEMIQCTP